MPQFHIIEVVDPKTGRHSRILSSKSEVTLARFGKVFLLGSLALFLVGCGATYGPSVRDVTGEYVYRYKSGQVEVWILKDDLSYEQEFFNSTKEYDQRSGPRFTNSGKWGLQGRTVTFGWTLNFFDYGNLDHALDSPEHIVAQPADWVAPSGNDEAKIAIGVDIDYILKRVKKPSVTPLK